jgi:acyl-CoA thioesterase I
MKTPNPFHTCFTSLCLLLLLASYSFAQQRSAIESKPRETLAQTNALPRQTQSVLFFGDSLSAAYGIDPKQGWVALAAPELAKAGFSVVNASVSGETTAGGLSRLPALLKKHQPRMLVLALGANDGLRGLDPTQMQRNLLAMIRLAKAHSVSVLLIGIRIPPNFGPEYTQAFEAAFVESARVERIHLLPFLLAPLATDRAAFQADALHPTAAAQPKIWTHVRASLLAELKKLPRSSPKAH